MSKSDSRSVSARGVRLSHQAGHCADPKPWQMSGVCTFHVLLESCREISSNSSQRARTLSRYQITVPFDVAGRSSTQLCLLCRLHSRCAYKPGAQSVAITGASSTKARSPVRSHTGGYRRTCVATTWSDLASGAGPEHFQTACQPAWT